MTGPRAFTNSELVEVIAQSWIARCATKKFAPEVVRQRFVAWGSRPSWDA